MTTKKMLIAVALAASFGAPAAGILNEAEAQVISSTGMRIPYPHTMPIGLFGRQSELASLDHADAWLNGSALTPEALRGKVVLINFWTYSCINWRRQLPYLRTWHEKYKDQGLVVIGVHAPEFEFEKSLANVGWATKDMRIDYPVAVDNSHAIWRGFRNGAWPALYFIDAQGRLRHQFLGEGSYQQSEMVIQALLREAGASGTAHQPAAIEVSGHELAADWANLRSPENYIGFARTENFASPGGLLRNAAHRYQAPAQLDVNEWALSGDWTVRKDTAALNAPNGAIRYRFHARDLHLVMGPAKADMPVKFRVLIDGKAPGPDHGVDIDAQGYGTVTEQRMYQLVRQSGPVADRLFEIEFSGPGVEAFAFSFG